MSSIYRKGRDGYYYYQTYIYNPETKKKNKRIFHSLKTKDTIKAKEQQAILDAKYKEEANINPTLKLQNFKRSIKLIALALGILVIIEGIFDLNKNDQLLNKSKSLKGVEEIDKKAQDVSYIDSNKNNIEFPKEFSDVNSQDSKVPLQGGKNPQSSKTKINLPQFTIERVDRLSGGFKQCKIFVTINENSNDESQLQLCKELAKQHNEFSNILICLYTNDNSGKFLARGNHKEVSIEKKKESWLAMYTLNPVEGENFDNNPGSYLGIY